MRSNSVPWTAKQPRLAPDGRIGIIAGTFARGLSIVAAGRDPTATTSSSSSLSAAMATCGA